MLLHFIYYNLIMEKKIFVFIIIIFVCILFFFQLKFTKFLYPEYLFLLVLLIPFFFIGWYCYKNNKNLRNKYDFPLQKKENYIDIIKLFSFLLIYSLMILALARPLGEPNINKYSKPNVEILLLLDVSTSMKCKDVLPDRLEVAKKFIENFLEELTYHKVGLMIFDNEATSICPFTQDYSTLKTILQYNINNIKNSSLNKGTNIENAIKKSLKRFKNKESKSKIIILITDGEDQTDNLKWVYLVKKNNVVIYTIGIGSLKGGKVPIDYDFYSKPIYLIYQGKEVITQLDKLKLINISNITGGKYFLPEEYKNLIFTLNKHIYKVLKDYNYFEYKELYSFLITIILILNFSNKIITLLKK